MNNKKVLLIESCEKRVDYDFKNSCIVHVRNSIIIKKILDCDLISHASEITKIIENKYDTIICMYGSPYMKYEKYMSVMDKNCDAKMFWLVNDHDLEDNILLRKWLIKFNTPYNMICNNPREGYRHWILNKNMHNKKLNDWINEWHTVNLNCLIFDADVKRNINQNLFKKGKEDCIYFGTYRKHRINDMLKYNLSDLVLSTSVKNKIKFQESGVIARYIDKLSWEKGKETLFDFKYSIYFEDLHTHTNYAFMANRFYECVMCDVLMFFDCKCSLVVEKSGYIIDKYLICQEGFDLKKKINELENDNKLYNDLLNKQRENIYLIKQEQKEVMAKLKQIVYN